MGVAPSHGGCWVFWGWGGGCDTVNLRLIVPVIRSGLKCSVLLTCYYHLLEGSNSTGSPSMRHTFSEMSPFLSNFCHRYVAVLSVMCCPSCSRILASMTPRFILHTSRCTPTNPPTMCMCKMCIKEIKNKENWKILKLLLNLDIEKWAKCNQ